MLMYVNTVKIIAEGYNVWHELNEGGPRQERGEVISLSTRETNALLCACDANCSSCASKVLSFC